MTLVLGIHGAKGSGKDQLYKALKDNFPHLDIRKIAYADPIKAQVCRIFGLANEEEYDEFKRANITFSVTRGYTWNVNYSAGRRIVREIGMMMRQYDPQQFVRYVEDHILSNPRAIWVITDLRFDNELESVQRLNGHVIKIKRAGFEFDGHATETELPDDVCSAIIYNNQLTLDQYNQLVCDKMSSLLQTLSTMKERE